jgi:hypothetical protein
MNSTHLLGTGRENQCFQGRCICQNGYTCPMCNLAQQGIGAGQHCPVPIDEKTKYAQVTSDALDTQEQFAALKMPT